MNHDQVRETVRNWLAETVLVPIDDPKLTDETNLLEAGYMDSYGLVELVAFIESSFAIQLADDELMSAELSSVGGVCNLILRKTRKR